MKNPNEQLTAPANPLSVGSPLVFYERPIEKDESPGRRTFVAVVKQLSLFPFLHKEGAYVNWHLEVYLGRVTCYHKDQFTKLSGKYLAWMRALGGTAETGVKVILKFDEVSKVGRLHRDVVKRIREHLIEFYGFRPKQTPWWKRIPGDNIRITQPAEWNTRQQQNDAIENLLDSMFGGWPR